MDELELLKNDWQREDNKNFPVLGYEDIYKMILKKSSSIVKWIFIISILEFIFWLLLAFGMKFTNRNSAIENLESSAIFITLSVVSYAVLGYFFYRFYTNYKRISTTDSASGLMESILKTRRTVKLYVGFNIVTLIIGFFVLIPKAISLNPKAQQVMESAAANGELFKYYTTLILKTVLLIGSTIAILLGIYWLIYGILLKRLNRNYEELKKLEV